MLLSIYIPPLFLLTYLWFTPESVRWLLTQGKIDDARKILRNAAKMNRKTISDETLKNLTNPDMEINKSKYPVKEVIQSLPILFRFIICCICWISCTFLFFGITLTSVTLAGNHYLDFTLTSLIEIPAYFVTYTIVDKLGRRWTQCSSFLLTGVASLICIFANSSKFVT